MNKDSQISKEEFANKNKVLIMACGMALLQTQYIFTREVGSTFFSTEIIAIFSTVIILIGISVSYGIGYRLLPEVFKIWTVVNFVMCVFMPLSIRAIYIYYCNMHDTPQAYLIVGLWGIFILGGYFAVFLPKFINDGVNFSKLYIFELIGSLTGLILILVLQKFELVLLSYNLALLVIFYLTISNLNFRILATGLVLVMMIFYPFANEAILKKYYSAVYGLNYPSLIFSQFSPYYLVDVVSSNLGLSLFLDGVPYYENSVLTGFNYGLSFIPGSLKNPQHESHKKALVVGSGSLSSAAYLKQLNYDVTVCEIDPVVLDAGLKFFKFKNHLKSGDFKTYIGDCRTYLNNLPAESLDLVVMDVPAPYHIQTAMLHTTEFYNMVKSKLKNNGLLSLSLCGGSFKNHLSVAIAASASKTFPCFIANDSHNVDMIFIYASKDPNILDIPKLKSLLPDLNNLNHYTILNQTEVLNKIKNAKPLTNSNLIPTLFLMRNVL